MRYQYLLTTIAAAVVVTTPVAASDATTFAPEALVPGSILHHTEFQARNNGFFLLGKTETFCSLPPRQCPPGKKTAVHYFPGSGEMSMDVSVPGGQAIYIAKNGALKYTKAHGGGIPHGAITKGFTYSANPGPRPDTWGHKHPMLACPVDGDGSAYQIFFKVPGFDKPVHECIHLHGGVEPFHGIAAYAYS